MLRVGTLLLAGTLAVVSTSGFAADLAYRKAPLPADPAFNWSGFYVGVNAGGGWYDGRGFAGSSNVTSLVPAGSIVSFPPNPARNDPGVTVGGLAGYNYQIGSLVLGAEADFNYADLKSRHSGGVTTICCGGAVDTLSYDSRSQLDWFGTMRARSRRTPPTPRSWSRNPGATSWCRDTIRAMIRDCGRFGRARGPVAGI